MPLFLSLFLLMNRLLSCKMKAIINIYITLQAIILKTDQQSQNICQLEI